MSLAHQSQLPVALDAMGGDFAPKVCVQGAIDAFINENVRTVLVGDEQRIRAEFASLGAEKFLKNDSISIYHAPEWVEMDEKPAQVLRKKKSSSMHLACKLVKQGSAKGALSAGNSGAMMVVALATFGRIKGILRPAIATLMPRIEGTTLVLDAGANTECEARYLLQFGLIGHVFMRQVRGIKKPRIGILSNGEEDSKGTDLTRDALALLRLTSCEVVGHCEGRDIFTNVVDVAVCDGFSGDVLLKTAEGTAEFAAALLRKGYRQGGWLDKIGARFSGSIIQNFNRQIDPREFGAAPLLGIKGVCYIAHGRSDAYTIQRAISLVHRHADSQFEEALAEEIMAYEHLLSGAQLRSDRN